MMNHVIELPLPFLLLLPWRSARVFAGMIQILFQVSVLKIRQSFMMNFLSDFMFR
jgi:hypothetical protein